MQNNLIICYGSDKITLNQDGQHIILTNGEAGYLLRSLLSNLQIVEIKTK